ncbi:single-stranded-DNA-specific exonuclease RecJ [Sphingobacteriales bacterium UPWRP_1]|nr:single-stranded-DNA-specific exonuclease RecJ [Sphingobacteriales bacterium TSM_CSM]PSJ76492.1 single-stranded-DNA-specific exonuclease RecJ [Sphingobacteriales bacterium UPWRP_1]
MNKRWVLTETDEQAVDELHESLRINRILCKLLVQRGVKTFEDARKFFRPSLETHLYDPFLMQDMDKAVERIDRAMQNKEKILVYGDYDVDGTTAVALLYGFIKDLYFYVDYYVPDRYKEGYGISTEGINWAKEGGFSLIIAVDCGIKANDKVQYALDLGIDFIICDHHRPGEELPPAYAVLDPKRTDCDYPFKELSGCGIAFKLVQALAATKHLSFKKVTRYLDLVAVSIAADIVPIVDENRVLAYYGLKQLNRNPRPGLRSLIELNPINRELSISDIVYIIAPRINAAGRMDDARQAVRLLISQEGAIAKKNANELQLRNSERKIVDMGITEEALLMVENDPVFLLKKTTVLFKPDWHKGVIGIVASRLIERFFRPTIVLTASNNIVSGSARSIPGFDIYNAIKECSDLLDQFGGHKYAAGLTLKEENLVAFIDRFETVVADTIDDDLLIPEIQIDAELPLKDVTAKFYQILQQFAPFGPGNTRPVFVCTDVTSTKWTSVVGNNHLKLYLKQENSPVVKGIAYNMGHLLEPIANGEPFDMCFTLEENKYNGNTTLQVNVRDVLLHSEHPITSDTV